MECPTGGVDLHTLAAYGAAGASAFGLGSKLLLKDDVLSGNYEALTVNASYFVGMVRKLLCSHLPQTSIDRVKRV